MGLINYEGSKTKCRQLKKILACKGTLRQVFIRVYILGIQSDSQTCWYFRPSFVNYCPSNLLSDSRPLFPVSKYVDGRGWWGCMQWGLGGVEFCWRPYSKNCKTILNKNLGGEGASDR